MPGGVNSPVRAFSAVGGDPVYIQSARGAILIDADGREYVDYIGSWGAMIAGHAHPEIVEAVQATAARGTSFGTCCELEVELAACITSRMEHVQMVRMVNSGTEAVMSAIRLARAATGREKILKFTGCYHGHADALLVSAGSGVATLGLPNSPGVTSGAVTDTLTAPFNNVAAVQQVFCEHGDDLAAVVVEPIAGNMGVVVPNEDFLPALRRFCDRHGTLLIFDEVMTGFRVANGGAQEIFNIRPDITTLGKIIGGGLPVGAYGGSSALMETVAPRGSMYQAGTLSGNPLAMACGLATLRLLDDDAYARLERLSARLAEGLWGAFRSSGVDVTIRRAGSMMTAFFTDGAVTDFDGASACDHQRFAAFFRHMLGAGVFLPPGGFEAMFVSLGHDEAVIDRTCAAATQFARSL
jgi:glutamate-1-semialdehyde 2,1-aminomutase